ncbi:hypothetical protein PDIG_46060 [Penicillium digitatum PHI26]|uniref:Uncharacterized protein n=2 Tax=Penicillium digitatum TaxID=36651 RepID=K9GGB2_PEND2|nr:hypothetical protein PDIP_17990 [Penicillium digitatum Pd1]EKV12281.1 hypothetical protein PDIG_46060 [Penicillium digitatum PHI26]EKV20259.1 hypothetical protein PDIP_17990 [Penicillium digitatum Pd1]
MHLYYLLIIRISVLGQCLDLMDSRPDLHHIPARPEATAVPRP